MNENLDIKTSSKSSIHLYLMLWLVVIIWSFSPLIFKYAYTNYFSPIFLAVLMNFISAFTLLILSIKKLNLINKQLLKVAIPTGLANGIANLIQKIGLQYTTPAKYAFLENLSCVIIPILVFIFIRKKPNIFKILSAILCLVGAFFLSGMSFSSNSFTFGKGEFLCSLAGILYGFNIAGTGVYAKNLDTDLYVFIHQIVAFVTNTCALFIFGFIPFGGSVLEPIKFSFAIIPVVIILYASLISTTFCWRLRTKVAKELDPTVIGVIMPFSAVITTILSVLLKMDTLSLNLVLGSSICLLAVLVSTFGDYIDRKKNHDIKSEK